MPLYEYQCDACGQIIEELQKFSDPPLTACKHCQGTLTKLISHSAFHLKGGGWYVSEYGSRKPNSAAASSESAAPDKKPEAAAAPAAAAKTDA